MLNQTHRIIRAKCSYFSAIKSKDGKELFVDTSSLSYDMIMNMFKNLSKIDIGRSIYSNITGGKAIIVLPLFFYRNQKGADKIEYSKPSLVAMAHARTIATFFVAKNQLRMEVYHEKI